MLVNPGYFGLFVNMTIEGVYEVEFSVNVLVYFEIPDECHTQGQVDFFNWGEKANSYYLVDSDNYHSNWIAASNFSFSGLSSVHSVYAMVKVRQYVNIVAKRGGGFDEIYFTSVSLGMWNEERSNFSLEGNLANGKDYNSYGW